MAKREATCNCGQLRVTVEGDPLRVSVCHCLACQRRTGSAFGFQARFPRDRVVTTGDSREYVRTSDDGEGRTFNFCPDCGATVWYWLNAEPTVIAVPAGAFADPDFPAPDHSVWESRKHAWVTMPGGIERGD